MPTAIQRRGGTASAHNTFTGAERELTVNTTNNSVHVHDGSTAGGTELARADLTNVTGSVGNLIQSGSTTPSSCSLVGNLFYNTTEDQLLICDGSNFQAAGVAGDSVKPIYQRSATQPATPSQSATVPAGWYGDTADVPSGTDPIWVSYGIKASGAINFTWQTPVQLSGADGTDGTAGEAGVQSASGYLYFDTQTLQVSPPSAPSASNFNFTTGEFGTITSGWSPTITVSTPLEGYAYWAVRYNVEEVSGGGETVTISSVYRWQNFNGLVTFTNIEAGIDDNVTTIDGGNVNLINLNATNITAGTINADRIAAGSIEVEKLTSGNLTTGVEFELGESTTVDGNGTGAAFNSTTSKYGAVATNTGNFPAMGVAAVTSSDFALVVGSAPNSTFGTFQTAVSFCSNASSIVADGNVSVTGNITATGTITPFTGAHLCLIASEPSVGDIVVDTGDVQNLDISNSVSTVAQSSAVEMKSVVGVYTGLSDDPIISKHSTENIFDNVVKDGKDYCLINSLGEGLINVCGENGNIEAGDLIVTSSTAGKGMKQADGIIRNTTVAKARETVTFSSPTEVKQIACIYLCG